MNLRLTLCLLPLLGLGAARSAETVPLNPNAEADGQALVAELLAQRPAQNFTNQGLLSIRPPKGAGPRRFVPVQFRILTRGDSWTSIYETAPTNGEPCVRLSVARLPAGGNEYRLAQATNAAGLDDAGKVLAGDETMTPFAGSDFWSADLGLEFLHWPTQRLLKKEMKRGQSCNVLESRAPASRTNGYVRVMSWLDIDSGGVMYAEGFDASGKLLKEFAPKGVTKVQGRWELEEMEIINRQTGSRTRIQFTFGEE